jgi:hypothetical protein
MKKTCIGLVVLLVFGLVLVGCPNNTTNTTDDDIFEGTWVGTSYGQTLTIVAANNSWQEYTIISGQQVEIVRGTYTISGNTATVIITHINEGARTGTDNWKTFAETSDEVKAIMNMTSNTFPGTIADDQMTANEVLFTKQ